MSSATIKKITKAQKEKKIKEKSFCLIINVCSTNYKKKDKQISYETNNKNL